MANPAASDVSLDDMLLNGAQATSDVTDAVTSTNLTQTISGASTLLIDLLDTDRSIVQSDLCTSRTTLALDDLTFEIVAVAKQSDQLSLTFEDYAVASLRHHKKVMKAASGTTSRVEFCRRIIAKDEPWIVVDGPATGPTILEEISTGQTASSHTVAAVNTPTESKTGQVQLSAVEAGKYLYDAGFRGQNLTVAIAVAHAESGFNASDVGHDSNGTIDVGLMQINSVHGYSEHDMFDPVKNTVAAYKIWKGAGWSAWTTHNNGAYKQYMAAAQTAADQVISGAGNTTTAGAATTDASSKPEDHWTAITRIMGEIQWRVFARRGHIVIAPDSWLLKQAGITINEQTDGVDTIDFEVDHGQKVSTVTITCRADRWGALPGEPVTVTDLGPADDTWLLSQIARPLTSTSATVTLVKKQKALPEPDSSSNSALPTVGQNGRSTGELLCPFAKHRIMPFNGSLPKRQQSPTVILHTNGGGTDHGSLYSLFSRPGNKICSHFQVMNDGIIEQYVTLDRQAYAQYAGNAFAVSIETEDDGNPSKPWTKAQLSSIIRLAEWVGCPGRAAPDGPGGGIGWHEEYHDWNTDGHVCPGKVRESQIRRIVIPAVRKEKPGGSP